MATCATCGNAGVFSGTLPLRDGELAHSPHAGSGDAALYCADCLAEIPRPPETEDFMRFTVRDLAMILAAIEGCEVPQADRDRIADRIRETITPEEYERECPIPAPARTGGA